MKSLNVAAVLVASICVLSGCKTGNKVTQPDAALVEGPKKIEIVEPEGVNLSDVVSFHGLSEYKPYYYYNAEMPPEVMRLYRHRFVELDGQAPAEVILTMVRKNDLDVLGDMDELPPYTSVMHHVYSFKEDKNGTYLGSFASDLMNPYSTVSLKILPVELDDDGRQELLLTDETAYYMPLQLFELREGTDRIQDVIWSEPEARSFVPYDHDNDGTLDLMAFPSADIISGLTPLYGAIGPPKEPFILARDDQGFWHVQPIRRPYERWATPMLMEYLETSEQLSYSMLDGLKAYSKVVSFTFPPEVYERLIGHYEGLDDPFERAEMLVSMPMASPQIAHQLCVPILDASDSLELQAACLAALGDQPDEANRELILEHFVSFQSTMLTYPQLHPRYYQVQKFSSLSMWIAQAFEAQGDDRFLVKLIDHALQDIDDQTFYARTGELYPLMQWGYDGKVGSHRFVLDVFFERLREAISRNQGYEARVLFEPLNTTAFGSLNWYYQELARKNKGEVFDEEVIARGEEAEAIWKEALPASLFEPLIASSDPQLRILAIHYFANTDMKRYAELFRVRVDVEKDEAVKQEMFGRLYVLTGNDTLSQVFWKSQILAALRSPNQQNSYASYSMLPYFMNDATPGEIMSLWDEAGNADFQQQMLWQIPLTENEDLSGEKWAGMRERVLAFYTQSSNTNHKSGLMYILPRMKSPEVIKLLRDAATQEQELYVVQGALQALITMKDEQAITLMSLREDDLRKQSYMYSTLLYAVSEHMPEQATALIIKDLAAQDPTQPLDSQLLWTVAGMMYRVDAKTTTRVPSMIPAEIIDWFLRDIDAGVEVPATSCVRLGQQVMMLFLAEEKDWEKRLEQVEAHPDCKSASTPYVARKFAVDAAISMSYQPNQQNQKIFSFIRQHHDFPYRPIRVSVVQFEQRLKAMAEEKEKQEHKKKNGQLRVP